jgi:transcription elongation factor Elf1
MSADEFDEDFKAGVTPKTQVVFREWDCPVCDANNPAEDGFRHGAELICCYCGLQFRVNTVAENRFSLIPI